MNCYGKRRYIRILAILMILSTVLSLMLISVGAVSEDEALSADDAVEIAEDVDVSKNDPSEKLALFDLTPEDMSGDNLVYTLTHLNVTSYIILALGLVLIIVVIVVIVVIIKKLKDSLSYV